MENNNKLDNEKQDFIDRKISGVKTIFGLVERDFMALMLTLSLLLNIVQYYDVRRTERVLNDEIKEEVRRQAVPAIKNETSKQLELVLKDQSVNRLPLKEVQTKLKSFDFKKTQEILNEFDKDMQEQILAAVEELRTEFLEKNPVIYRFNK